LSIYLAPVEKSRNEKLALITVFKIVMVRNWLIFEKKSKRNKVEKYCHEKDKMVVGIDFGGNACHTVWMDAGSTVGGGWACGRRCNTRHPGRVSDVLAVIARRKKRPSQRSCLAGKRREAVGAFRKAISQSRRTGGRGSFKKGLLNSRWTWEKLGVSDGDAVFHLEVRDYSWRDWWHGNKTHVVKNISIDSKPPSAEVLSRAHNVNQGGAGLVVYRLSEPCPKSGVMVGDHFFPGHSGFFRQ
jgi:hypothetical protein